MKKYFSFLISHFSFQKGFTLIELIIVMAIFATLVGISTISLLNVKHKSTLNTVVNTFLADLKEQQIKAMVGDTEGSGVVYNYGIHFETSTYTLFHGTYSSGGTGNFVVPLTDTVQFNSFSQGNSIIFAKGSGEASGMTTITLIDTVDNNQKTITVNQYGVVTGIN